MTEIEKALTVVKEDTIAALRQRIEDGDNPKEARKLLRLLVGEQKTDIQHHDLCYCVDCL